MNGEATRKLARTVVSHSLRVEAGQRVLIDVLGRAEALAEALIEAVYEAGATPFVHAMPVSLLRGLVSSCTVSQLVRWFEMTAAQMKAVDAYIGIRSDDNAFDLEDVPPDRHRLYVRHYQQPKQAAMAALGKWVLLREPTPSLAQSARMSSASFARVYEQACGMDYAEWSKRAEPLADLLRRTDRVRIVSPDTDLSFSIAGMDAFVCDGRYNLPDGEVFTAPLQGSVEGHVAFNVPSSYMGQTFDQVRLTFRSGQVADVRAPRKEAIEALLGQDGGASRIGEFGIGLNPYIRSPMHNLLFDEKMSGSVHLALGQAYPMADNGNRSALHWDLVLNQSAEFGGGELLFDGKTVRRDGLFVLPSLLPLNPPHGDGSD